jgi:AcrR family transcriptional regulator
VSAAAAPRGPAVKRLPPGRHGLSREQVRESQRRRLTAAAAAALAERGYGRITLTGVSKGAGVSTATFYQHFDDLWDCLLAAYDEAAKEVCEAIERACIAAGGGREEQARTGIEAGLSTLAGAPPLAHLLSAEPPSQAPTLWAARRRLVARLAALLREVSGSRGDGRREARLAGGALALIASRARADGAGRLPELAPMLTMVLLEGPPYAASIPSAAA